MNHQITLTDLTCNDIISRGIDPVLWVNAHIANLEKARLPADLVATAKWNMQMQVCAFERLHDTRTRYEEVELSVFANDGKFSKADLYKADDQYEKAWEAVKAGNWHNCHRNW
jgi:hypothetical protein